MGLFDGYFDPQQFGEGGGLLGRLLALQQQLGQYQSDGGADLVPSAPQPTPPQPISSFPGYGQSFPTQMAAPDLASQYQTLRPILGDHPAMLATVNPDAGKALIAQALTNVRPADTDNAAATDNGRPVISDVSPDPVRPGSQFAQAGMALCGGGPIPCAAGLGLTAGQALWGGAALLGGAAILNNAASRPPAGSRPINQTDWSGDHKQIKKAIGAQPTNDVRISPSGEVWAQKPDGSWESHGPAETFTGSGKPIGRRGADRDQ
jgi:hypothetical protein